MHMCCMAVMSQNTAGKNKQIKASIETKPKGMMIIPGASSYGASVQRNHLSCDENMQKQNGSREKALRTAGACY